jgi:Outer membrane efflux protein
MRPAVERSYVVKAVPSRMKSGGRMIGLLRVVTCSLVILLWVPATLIAGEVSLNEAVAVAVEKNPDLAVVANELVVVRGELQRANYISQFNPKLGTDGDYQHRDGRSNAQEWRVKHSQELEIFGQPALRRRSATFGYQRTWAEVRNQTRLLTAAVKMTFYEALRDRCRSELLTELASLDQRLFRAAQSRSNAGEIGQIDLNGISSRDTAEPSGVGATAAAGGAAAGAGTFRGRGGAPAEHAAPVG